ncbi:hypothetical protein TgHK011_003301 [Trichoderma gracile]|nr:hypothetical protein TgHK011_003301 [Trichoderma gracile]
MLEQSRYQTEAADSLAVQIEHDVQLVWEGSRDERDTGFRLEEEEMAVIDSRTNIYNNNLITLISSVFFRHSTSTLSIPINIYFNIYISINIPPNTTQHVPQPLQLPILGEQVSREGSHLNSNGPVRLAMTLSSRCAWGLVNRTVTAQVRQSARWVQNDMIVRCRRAVGDEHTE